MLRRLCSSVAQPSGERCTILRWLVWKYEAQPSGAAVRAAAACVEV
ncbi:hypothetical protein [Ureibacillus sp. FSL W7-1570]|uniref:Uncharacterized protein n=1 Tax=Ureibacillus suwonensis TaxID=313007 RepID=A0ABW0R831_9BACL